MSQDAAIASGEIQQLADLRVIDPGGLERVQKRSVDPCALLAQIREQVTAQAREGAEL